MADRPMLFSGPMVRALVAGSKTQTRRILKPQPSNYQGATEPPPGMSWVNKKRDAPYFAQHDDQLHWGWWDEYNREGPDKIKIRVARGDRLWVRETWTHTGTGVWTIADTWHARDGSIAYKADGAIPGGKYWPSIHMPRRYSRITLTVTEVRVERLLDISEADALAEGCVMSAPVADIPPGPNPQASYLRLWDKINGDGAAALNPWVAAYSFTVHRHNIDRGWTP